MFESVSPIPFPHEDNWDVVQSFLEQAIGTLEKSMQRLSTPVLPSEEATNSTSPPRHVLLSLQTVGNHLRLLGRKPQSVTTKVLRFLLEHEFPVLISSVLQIVNHSGVLRSESICTTALSLLRAVLSLSDIVDSDNNDVKFNTGLAQAGLLHLLHENISLCRHADYSQNDSRQVRGLVELSLELMSSLVRHSCGLASLIQQGHFSTQWKWTLREVAQLHVTEHDQRVATVLLGVVLDHDIQESPVSHIKSLWSESCCQVVATLVKMTEEADRNVEEGRRVHGFTVEELLEIQARLTIRDEMQEEFVEHNGVELMQSLCSEEHPNEAYRATQIICNLLFHEKLKSDLMEKRSVSTFLDNLRTTKVHFPKTVMQNVNTALWMMNKRHKSSHIGTIEKATPNLKRLLKGPTRADCEQFLQATVGDCELFHHLGALHNKLRKKKAPQIDKMKQQAPSSAVTNIQPCDPDPEVTDAGPDECPHLFTRPVQGKFFISYCHENKEVVHKLWHRMEAAGFSCWIDEEQMQENMFDVISEAIDESAAVLACMSEAYLQSPHTRLEATYAWNCQKQMVFLTVQEHFHATKWLRYIQADNYYYDISGRRDVDQVISRLLQRLSQLTIKRSASAFNLA